MNIFEGSGLEKNLTERGWTKEEIKTVIDHFNQIDFENDYEYYDNIRLARSENQKEVWEYYDRQNKGCCGFYDTEVNGILMGFNYGH